MDPTLQYVTKSEFDVRSKGMNDKVDFYEQKSEMRASALEKKIDEHIEIMKAIGEKNLAELKAANAEMRADISEIRGEVSAISAKVDAMSIKFGWYIALLGIGVSLVMFLVQKF